jgi:hypothetical protein
MNTLRIKLKLNEYKLPEIKGVVSTSSFIIKIIHTALHFRAGRLVAKGESLLDSFALRF